MTNLARLHLRLRLAQGQRLHHRRAAVEAPARGRAVVLHHVAAGAIVGLAGSGYRLRNKAMLGPVQGALGVRRTAEQEEKQ